jgi:hypothetical protein
MTTIQLEFFKTQEQCEIEALRKEVKFNFNRLEAVRKGTYSEINKIKKENMEMKEDIELIKRNICQNG